MDWNNRRFIHTYNSIKDKLKKNIFEHQKSKYIFGNIHKNNLKKEHQERRFAINVIFLPLITTSKGAYKMSFGKNYTILASFGDTISEGDFKKKVF